MNVAEIFQQIDLFYAELAQTSKDPALNAHDLPHITSVMARWEQIRDETAALTYSLKRQYHAKKFAYEDALRVEMSKDTRINAASAFEERKAQRESKVFTLLNEARAYETIIEYLKDFHWHLDSKIKWLNGLQIHARELDKRAFYQSSKDVFTVD